MLCCMFTGTQRNFYSRLTGLHGTPWVAFANESVTAGSSNVAPLNLTVQPRGYDLLESVRWHGASANTITAIVTEIDLSTTPSLAGRPAYFALRWLPTGGKASGVRLTLLIDPGNGFWQRSEVGLRCSPALVEGCTNAGPVLTPDEWTLRVFVAEMTLNGTARFAIRMVGPASKAAEISGIVIAPVGAPYSAIVV